MIAEGRILLGTSGLKRFREAFPGSKQNKRCTRFDPPVITVRPQAHLLVEDTTAKRLPWKPHSARGLRPGYSACLPIPEDNPSPYAPKQTSIESGMRTI